MKREHWGGRLAFVLAAAGSAVGLGNVWKFPYITGVHGGAAFILVYLVCIALVGMPIMVAELAIGRTTQKSPITAFRELAPKQLWWLVGAMGVLAGYVILSFYSVVAGWTIEYMSRSIQNDFGRTTSQEALVQVRDEYIQKTLAAAIEKAKEQSGGKTLPKARRGELSSQVEADATDKSLRGYVIGKAFGDYVASKQKPVMWHCFFMALTMFVVAAGVGAGIEVASKLLMPILVLILLGLAGYGLSLPGSWEGVLFLTSPDFSKLTAEAVLEALGHAFFTLSLGMGAMLTYGSYLDKKSNLYKAGALVVLADTLIALVAGLAIYPALFAFKLTPAAGPSLIFVTLPVIFSQMPGGYIIGGLFFFALFIAALTSAISLLEVCVAHLVDEWQWSRLKATLTAGLVIVLLGLPSAWGTKVTASKSFFDIMDMLSTNFLLPVGGMLTAIFVGWAWRREDALGAARDGDDGMTGTFGEPWIFLCRYVAPVLVLAVLIHGILGLVRPS